MTSQVASERFPPAGGARRASARPPRRNRSAGTLGWARFRRGFLRQIAFVAVVAATITALGFLFHTAGGAGLTFEAAAFYVAIALAVAIASGLFRELARNTITSVTSLGRSRGYSVLGAAPDLSVRALRQLPPDQRSPLGCLINDPASAFSTAFRDLQGNVASEGVVAFIGSFQGEGATTSALCVAASATQQGRSAIVVDCDLRRRSLTRGFGIEPELGVREACEQPEYWRDYVEEEHETGMHFLPAAKPLSPWRTLAGQDGLEELIGHLRQSYDLVVLDCPPALATAEGASVARLAQRCVVVAVWDQTPISAIRQTVRTLRRSASMAGVYVNRVPPGYRFGRVRPD